jgi:hypothetical protein
VPFVSDVSISDLKGYGWLADPVTEDVRRGMPLGDVVGESRFYGRACRPG